MNAVFRSTEVLLYTNTCNNIYTHTHNTSKRLHSIYICSYCFVYLEIRALPTPQVFTQAALLHSAQLHYYLSRINSFNNRIKTVNSHNTPLTLSYFSKNITHQGTKPIVHSSVSKCYIPCSIYSEQIKQLVVKSNSSISN